jgi:hypothetical protein
MFLLFYFSVIVSYTATMYRNSLTKQNARNKDPGLYPRQLREMQNLLYSDVTGETDNCNYTGLCICKCGFPLRV